MYWDDIENILCLEYNSKEDKSEDMNSKPADIIFILNTYKKEN